MKYTDILGVSFINGTIIEAVEKALRIAEERNNKYIVAPDSELMLAADRDGKLMQAVKGAEMRLPEGNGVIYSSQILGTPIKNRISAIDFASALMARMGEKGMSVFVLGTDADTVENAAFNIGSRYPGIVIAGSDDGYYSSEDDLLELINEASPDLLLVGYGSPNQEKWMYTRRDRLNVGLMLGFGKELKLVAGNARQAPMRWRESGFEWVYWLGKDPKRIGKMAKRSKLVLNALWRRIFN